MLLVEKHYPVPFKQAKQQPKYSPDTLDFLIQVNQRPEEVANSMYGRS